MLTSLAVLIFLPAFYSNISEVPACDCVTNSKGKPVALVIGEDLSQSTSNFIPIAKEDIRDLCEVIIIGERSINIMFVGFGTPYPGDFVLCTLDPIPAAPVGAALDCVSKCRQEAKRVKKNNEAKMAAFVDKCDQLLAKRNHQFTDLNGFFEKSSKFLNDKDFSKHEKWFLCNSDGLHDLGSGKKKTDCTLIPAFDKGYFSQWSKKAPNCPEQKKGEVLVSPELFFEKFKSTLTNTSAGKKKG